MIIHIKRKPFNKILFQTAPWNSSGVPENDCKAPDTLPIVPSDRSVSCFFRIQPIFERTMMRRLFRQIADGDSDHLTSPLVFIAKQSAIKYFTVATMQLILDHNCHSKKSGDLQILITMH